MENSDAGNKKVEISEKELAELKEGKDKLAQFDTTLQQLTSKLEKAEKVNEENERMFTDEAALQNLLKKKQTPSTVEEKNENLDDLSITQAVTLLRKERAETVKLMEEAFTKKMTDFDTRVGAGFALGDYNLTRVEVGADKFKPHEKRIWEIAKENPEWSTGKCLAQAQGEAEKVVREKVEADKVQASKEKTTFTEKGEVSPEVLQDKNLKGRAAAEKAYDLTIGDQVKEG